YDVKTMDALLADSLAPRRFAMRLLGFFAAAALFLAALGLYGVLSYAVTQRTREIGIRIALGAQRSAVIKLVVGQGLALAGFGLALGLVAAVTGTRLLTSMLFQVQPNDPVVYLAVVVLLGTVALVASYVPAWRASQIDPLSAIRQE